MTEHKIKPEPGTVRDWQGDPMPGYGKGPIARADQYPLHATCSACGDPVTCTEAGPWEHTLDYADLIRLVETAHGVQLTPAQIDKLNARLDDEEAFFPPMSFAEAMHAAITGDGPRIGIREHVLAVAAELEE